jgi:hypothetical protein
VRGFFEAMVEPLWSLPHKSSADVAMRKPFFVRGFFEAIVEPLWSLPHRSSADFPLRKPFFVHDFLEAMVEPLWSLLLRSSADFDFRKPFFVRDFLEAKVEPLWSLELRSSADLVLRNLCILLNLLRDFFHNFFRSALPAPELTARSAAGVCTGDGRASVSSRQFATASASGVHPFPSCRFMAPWRADARCRASASMSSPIIPSEAYIAA